MEFGNGAVRRLLWKLGKTVAGDALGFPAFSVQRVVDIAATRLARELA